MGQVATLTKAIKGLDKAIAKGTAKAMNNALVITQKNLIKKLSDETGLKRADVDSRVAIAKATVSNLFVAIAVATQYLIGLRKFSPLLKTVKVIPKNRSKSQPYTGVTVNMGDGRSQVAGGFALDTPFGLVVVGRKGDARKPIEQIKTDVFQRAAEKLRVAAL